MRKSKVNHEAIVKVAVSAPKNITRLVELIRNVNVFVDKFNVDVFNEREFHGFLKRRKDEICEINEMPRVLQWCCRALASEFRVINGGTGRNIIPDSAKLTNEEVVNELLKYFVIKVAETQMAEFERDEARRAAEM